RRCPRSAHAAPRAPRRLPVEDLAELFDVEMDAEEVGTVGGLLAHALGRVPIEGSTAEVASRDGETVLSLKAETIAGRRNRVGTVLVRRLDGPPDKTDTADAPDAENSDRAR